jgi:hypothetical protein
MPPTETAPTSTEVELLRRRVDELEAGVAQLRYKLQSHPEQGSAAGRPWWEDRSGAFAGDPGFEEMVDLGRQWRENQRDEARRDHDNCGGETPA